MVYHAHYRAGTLDKLVFILDIRILIFVERLSLDFRSLDFETLLLVMN